MTQFALTTRRVDGRLIDSSQVFHPPETLYRVGIRSRSTTRTAFQHVPGVEVAIGHPDYTSKAGWFAYNARSAEGVMVWFLVHHKSGVASGQARSLRGCIHTAISRMLAMRPENLAKCLAKATREAARSL